LLRDLMLAAIALEALVEYRMSFRKLLHLIAQSLEQDSVGANPVVQGVETPAHGGHALVQLGDALLHVGEALLHVGEARRISPRTAAKPSCISSRTAARPSSISVRTSMRLWRISVRTPMKPWRISARMSMKPWCISSRKVLNGSFTSRVLTPQARRRKTYPVGDTTHAWR